MQNTPIGLNMVAMIANVENFIAVSPEIRHNMSSGNNGNKNASARNMPPRFDNIFAYLTAFSLPAIQDASTIQATENEENSDNYINLDEQYRSYIDVSKYELNKGQKKLKNHKIDTDADTNYEFILYNKARFVCMFYVMLDTLDILRAFPTLSSSVAYSFGLYVSTLLVCSIVGALGEI